MNGAVIGIAQIGNKIVVAGTFTSVSPAGTFSNKADDVTRNRIFAFDATTGVIDPNLQPQPGGAANSVDTDGTNVYVGGLVRLGRRQHRDQAGGQAHRGRQRRSGFKARARTAAVNEVVVRGSRLYVGGGFTNIKSGP